MVESGKSFANAMSCVTAMSAMADTYLDEPNNYPIKLGYRHNFPTSVKTRMKNRKHRKIAKRSKKANRKK